MREDPQLPVHAFGLLTAAKCADYAAPLREAYRAFAPRGWPEPSEESLLASGYLFREGIDVDTKRLSRDASRMWATIALAGIATHALRAIWGADLTRPDAAVFEEVRRELQSHLLELDERLEMTQELPLLDDLKVAAALGLSRRQPHKAAA